MNAVDAAEPQRPRAWPWAVAVLAIGLGSTAVAWQYTRASGEAAARTEFEFFANSIVTETTDQFDAHVQTLWGIVGLIATRPDLTRNEWRTYVGTLQLSQRFPGIRGVGYAQRISDSEREAHITRMQADGAPDYAIWPAGAHTGGDPTVVTFVEPFGDPTLNVLGFDLMSRADRRVAVEQARDTGAPAVSPKLALLRDAQGAPQPGFLLFVPAYRRGAPLSTVDERRAAWVGVAYSGFRARDFIMPRSLVQRAEHAGVSLEIYDGVRQSEDDLLFRSDTPRVPATAGLQTLTIAELVGGRTWTFRLSALPSFVSSADQRVPFIILAAGALISLMASGMVGALALNRAQAFESNRRLREDVLRRERVEDQLRESESRFRLLFDNIPFPTFAIDRQSLRFIEVNEAAVAKYGYTHEEFAGLSIAEIRPPEEVPALMAYMHSVRDQPSYGGEFRHRKRDGTVIDVDVTAHNIDLNGRRATIVVANDITERKRAQQALAESERQLRQAQRLEAVGQLTGGIAHDFNNILTVITGTIEILADGVAHDPKLASIARLIDAAAKRGADLTRDLLAFARRQPLEPQATDINALMANGSKLFRSALGQQIEVRSNLDPSLWPAFVDPGQLTTALLNLALNARDAMPQGGALTLETKNAAFNEAPTADGGDLKPGDYVMISVSDTGTGIAEAIREKVFEPFFTTKPVGKGTGLGLSMVYGFVKQSNGHIKIESREGRGATICIYLPRAQAKPVTDVEAAPVPAAGGRETILVVEDDALVRNYVTGQLKSLGYTTHVASNAAEALAIVDRGVSFDLLFTDVIMPGPMNGRRLAKEVRRRRGRTKVLLTSGYAQDDTRETETEVSEELLNKPYRKAELARRIRELLDADTA